MLKRVTKLKTGWFVMEFKAEENSEVSDRFGIFFSVLCCIHCMAIPLLIILAPSLGQMFENPYIHLTTMALVIPIGLYAFISKLKVHNNKRPLYIGIAGMFLLIAGHAFHELTHVEVGSYVEVVSSVIGGIALISAHLMNIRLCRCNTCHH